MVRPRTGSVYHHGHSGRWVGAISVGGGKRRCFYGHSEEEVRTKLAAEGVEPPRHNERRDYRALATANARAVLERAEALGWDQDMTARVMAASMTRQRIYRQIVGPCAYCGDEAADQIDHATPYTVGGQDVPENVVSACRLCNLRKGRKRAEDYVS